MEIHHGKKYTITAGGLTATKTDGHTARTMKFYPERDIAPLAGEIDPPTAWRLLADVAGQAAACPATPISPEHILIDGRGFVLATWSESHDVRFTAPEGYSAAWALGATVFYVFLGCHVFYGLGGKGQSATAPVPTLRMELPELSGLIARCLDFDPDKRPGLAEIARIASENLELAQRAMPQFPPLKEIETQSITTDEIDSYWPEEMC